MFKKVLVAEDILSINEGIKIALQALEIPEVVHVQYCDDAMLKIKRANLNEKPFDLLISDLSFKKDYRNQQITSGDQLIDAVKEICNNIKTIAYSIEDRPQRVRQLFTQQKINAYVCKDRNGLKELYKAVEAVYLDKIYISPQIEMIMKSNNIIELHEYDITLLKQLANGYTQEEIGLLLKKRGISPSSTSAIEKRLNKIKINFKANNAIHLIAIVKDLGLI